MSEHDEQVALINWCKMSSSAIPELDYIFAIPNGGKRNISVARKMKQEGVKAGVPDLFLPVPCSGFHGLFIEMKYGDNKMDKAQSDWAVILATFEYRHVVCHSWLAAARAILNYLQVKDFNISEANYG